MVGREFHTLIEFKCVSVPPALQQHHLPAVVSLGVLRGRRAFHAADARGRKEQVVREPVLGGLRLEMRRQQPAFPLKLRLRHRHEEVRRAVIAVVFRDLVLEHDVIAKGVPREIGEHAMVLMPVLTVVREHDVRLERFQRLEKALDRLALKRKEAAAKILHHNAALARLPQERLRARQSLGVAHAFRAEHHPHNLQAGLLLRQLQQRGAAADLDVIRVRTEAEDAFQFIKADRLHDDGSDGLRFPPQLPRRIATRVNLVEMLLLLEGVHARPEAVVGIGEQLALLDEPTEWLLDQFLAFL